MEKYKVLELLGTGGFGTVFKALDELERTVALKIIKTTGQRRENVRKLAKEFEIQMDWDRHPNIVKMLDYFQTNNMIGIVTEYCMGDLRSLMWTFRDGFSDTEIIKKGSNFSREIICGLHFLHSKGIIHRDIKPENILIGFDYKPKLGDFGLAKLMGDESIENMSVAGTRRYMAPEVIQRDAYGVKADIWSFGCVLYELIVGRPLIRRSSFFNLENWVGLLNIELPDYVTGNCRNFLEGLLQKTARKRLTWPRLEKHPFLEEADDDEGEEDEGGDVYGADAYPGNGAIQQDHGNGHVSARTFREEWTRSSLQLQCSGEELGNAGYQSFQSPNYDILGLGPPPRLLLVNAPDLPHWNPNSLPRDAGLARPDSPRRDFWLPPPDSPRRDSWLDHTSARRRDAWLGPVAMLPVAPPNVAWGAPSAFPSYDTPADCRIC